MKTSRIGRSQSSNVRAFNSQAGYLRAASERVKWRFTLHMVETK